MNIKLGEIATSTKGKKPKTLNELQIEGSIPYLDIRAFEKGDIRQYADTKSSRIIAKDDLAMVWDGARSGWVSTGKYGALGSTLAIIKVPLVEPNYLYRFLQLKFQVLNTETKGTGIPHVNPDVLWNLDFPIAPFNEQKRIADKLDKAFEYIDKVKSRMETIPELLKEFRKMVLQQAVQDNDLFPKNEVTIKDVIIGKPKNGFSPKGVNYETDVKSLTLSATTSGVFKGEHVKYLDIEKPNKDSSLWLKKGDILIQRSNTPDIVGISAVYTEEDNKFIYPDLMMKLKCNNMVIPEYLHFSLLASWYDGYFKEKATGTSSSMQKINQKIVLETPVNLPSIDDQLIIIANTKELLLIVDKVESRFNKIKVQLEDLPNQLLAKAFKGELVEPDLNDEPAEKLLERIKEEMEKLKSSSKKKKK